MKTALKSAGSAQYASHTPDPDILVSFLINALYLIGNHRILIKGNVDAATRQSLTGMGHRVDDDGDRAPRSNGSARYDRAMHLGDVLGYGTDAENLAWLRTMRRQLATGGVFCFQILDRDRAWNLVAAPTLAGIGLDPVGPAGFDPATGRLSAQVQGHAAPNAASMPGRKRISIRTYNLSEIGDVLRAAGFTLERAYGDWEGANPETVGAQTGRLIVVATKLRQKRRPAFVARSAPRHQD